MGLRILAQDEAVGQARWRDQREDFGNLKGAVFAGINASIFSLVDAAQFRHYISSDNVDKFWSAGLQL